MNASDRFVNEADRYLIRRVDGVGNGKPATLDEVRARVYSALDAHDWIDEATGMVGYTWDEGGGFVLTAEPMPMESLNG